jgi:uncharacterized protein (DUF1330 family)
MKPLVIAAICVGLGTPAHARGGGHGGFHPHGGPRAPTYLVVDINEMAQKDDLDNALRKLPTTLIPFAGRVIADSSSVNSLDGAAPARFVVIQFESAEKAREWDASNDGKEFEEVRRRAAKSREFVVEGRPIEFIGGPNSAGRQEMMKIRDQEIKSLNSICKGC